MPSLCQPGRGRPIHFSLATANPCNVIEAIIKQQASLFSFFGGNNKGKKKRQAESTSSNDDSNSSSSLVQSPVRKQIKKLSHGKSCNDESSCNNDDVPSLKSNSSHEVECYDVATSHAQKNDTSCEQTVTTNREAVVAAKANPDAASDTPTTDDTAESSSESEEEEEEEDDDNSSATSNKSGNVDASNNSSASPYNNSTSNTKYEGKSAYEILREKNIERNNERLRALGLLVGIHIQQQNNNNHNNGNRNKKRKKAKSNSSANAVASLPTRRSSRLKQPVVTEKGTLLEGVCHDGNEEGTAVPSNGGQENMLVDEEEEFTVSPLFEYQMMSTNNNESTHTTNEDNENGQIITTLIPKGPRLNPPSGLNAIYSLQFHPHCWARSDNDTTNDTIYNNGSTSWLVGAGKAGIIALWDCSKRNHIVQERQPQQQEEVSDYIDPIISWKGHGGRWIADARFIPSPSSTSSLSSNNSSNSNVPSRLLTAGNDGTICHWDLTLTSKTGVPKLLEQSSKVLHGKSGIFSMDVCTTPGSGSSNAGGAYIVTGSKDKSLALTTLDRMANEPIWRSTFHTAKVGCVCFSSSKSNNLLIASASDDGYVAVHDSRMDGMKCGTVATLEGAHVKPHSAVWKDNSDSIFMTGESSFFLFVAYVISYVHPSILYNLETLTHSVLHTKKAGLDEIIKLWDLRNTSSPLASYHGHVPGNGNRKLKRIHRPTFLSSAASPSSTMEESFILSGGEGSHAISMFQLGQQVAGGRRSDHASEKMKSSGDEGMLLQTVFSRGTLPDDVGDIGSMAVQGRDVAVAVEGGEVLLLSPK